MTSCRVIPDGTGREITAVEFVERALQIGPGLHRLAA